MIFTVRIRRWTATAFLAAAWSASTALAQGSGAPGVDAAEQANRAASATQRQINDLDDQTRGLLERYRAALWQTQQLNVYAQQVEPLLASEDSQRAALQDQLAQFSRGSHDITPLLLRMLDSLDKFVGLDLPFLAEERKERLAGLRTLMSDPGASQAEKYRRMVEAYRIEADYGRTLGAERMQVKADGTTKVADVLRLGRVALYYLSLDGREAGCWDAEGRQWRDIKDRYRGAIREGLRIARETAAPEVLELPVPAAASGSPQTSLDSGHEPLHSLLRQVASHLLTVLLPAAEAAPLDDLLRQIHDAAQSDAHIDQAREQRFLADRNQQQAELAQAEAGERAAQGKADAVRGRYETAQKAIADLKTQIQAQSGDLGQVYAAVRDAASQFKGDVGDSFLSAQFPERLQLLDKLADPANLPGMSDLENFWYALQQEMTENGKVARFNAEVIGADGQTRQRSVVRVGPFAAVSDGDYLISLPGGHLQVPERRTLKPSVASEFAATRGGWAPLAIDPTHGGLLKLAAQRPSLVERISQGGIVGYTIIVVGVTGAALALFQLAYLFVVGGRITRQLRQVGTPSTDNPLGRVLSCLKDDSAFHDPEVLETRISEAVLRETPRIERFQPFLRMVVAAGPLLGLLGTVTGMIITVLGLLIAIPILFINSILAARSRVLVQILDEQSAGLLARRLEQQMAQPGQPHAG